MISHQKRRPKRTTILKASFSSALYKAVLSDPAQTGKPTGGDFDRLMRYVIYKESPNHPAYKENPLTTEEVRSIEKNCKKNPEWAKVLADLHHEYHRLLEALDQSSFSHIPEPVTVRPAVPMHRFRLFTQFPLLQFRLPRLATISAVILIAGFGLLAGMSSLVTPRYFEATTITPATFTTRGESSSLGLGINALHQKDYPTAFMFFQRTINQKPHTDEAFLASYFSGSIHLTNARRTLFGLFLSFEQAQVDSGIVDFTYVLQNVQNAEEFRSLEEQCRFILGQAWLMKKNTVNARQEFERVIQLHGIKKQESIKILSFLPLQ